MLFCLTVFQLNFVMISVDTNTLLCIVNRISAKTKPNSIKRQIFVDIVVHMETSERELTPY